MSGGWKFALAAALAVMSVQPSAAQIDLSRTSIGRLSNGLTVMILEDRTFPVVSVQALYKSGAADEKAGEVGLAHFLEHLAFRASKNFPDGAATEAIYDVGGEWHGYTWLDQTTYFATAPKDQLDLLLRIEADRMAHVTIDPAAIEAEKGAVIAELHSYENDPASVLLDAVTAIAFDGQGYGNNSIGTQSDVEQLTLEKAREFYAAHYVPANTILAIVGDVDPSAAGELVERYFGGLRPQAAAPSKRSYEPAWRGERRVTLSGPVDRQYFAIAYPAPAISNPDLPAFLVVQQLIGGGSGLNFNQNDWGTAAENGSILDGVASDIATWFIPTEERYLFVIKGSLSDGAVRESVEREVARRLESLRDKPPSEARLAAAKVAVLRQLAEDVETTEDAAHQLAYMAGVGGHDMMMHLPERLAAVTPGSVQSVASAYLADSTRTVGWYSPGAATAPAVTKATSNSAAEASEIGGSVQASALAQSARPSLTGPASHPQMDRLTHGLPIMIQENPRIDKVTVQLLLSAPVVGEDNRAAFPGLGVVTRSGNAADLASLIADAKAAAAKPLAAQSAPLTPDAKLENLIASTMNLSRPIVAKPVLAVVTGGVETATAQSLLERAFGSQRTVPFPARSHDPRRVAGSKTVRMDRPYSQGALGYVVPAPPPRKGAALAWRMLLYVLSHDYSGRLGRSAIGDKGLAYHIASAYRTDGRKAWITLATGVDPGKADALEAELKAQLAGLVSNPATEAEVAAARNHILGRSISSAQSNQELADKLTRDFLQDGKIRTYDELRALLQSITVADVAAAAAEFGKGTILRVDVDPPKR